MHWDQPCAYDEAQKRRFHATARARLRQLAVELRLPAGSYDLRSNKGGIAVSGEITLHHEAVYVQVSQSAMGGDMGILIRTCRRRRDYTGGANNFAPLGLLDDLPALATLVCRVAPAGSAVRTAA
ncbi:MAG: hypothetical protein H0T75_07320 [Rhizobiales bacterium]|nr:hypothetical protein [Hyphomicrobiales bacterium]MDQ3557687.1 hypothetical protein [Pseudomonadota bacterium]